MSYTKLASAATSSGPGTAYQWMGGSGVLVTNNIGTGAVTVQCSPDNSAWVSMHQHNSTATAAFASGENGVIKFSLPAGMWIRADITTGSSTGLDLWAISG